MGRRPFPSELEESLLLILASFPEHARGREISERLAAATGHEVSLAAIYITLGRTEKKGWVNIRTARPEPGVGGRPRKFFALTPEGARVLRGSHDERARLWAAARSHPFLAG